MLPDDGEPDTDIGMSTEEMAALFTRLFSPCEEPDVDVEPTWLE